MTDWSRISAAITSASGKPFKLASRHANGGGCINEAYTLDGEDGTRYFVKLNDARHHSMFVAEAAGLETIAATNTLRVPQPIAHGTAGRQSYLVLEHLDLNGRGNARQLGEQLAALHRSTSNRFGFPQDNFLGTTLQPNGWTGDWVPFWREHRLGFQLQLAAENGYGGNLQRLGEKLLDALPAFFTGYAPQPSLLHGDLWSGNHAFLADGMPVIFDPAPYYGDRECDLAMTELFGGYGGDFYAAYRATWPLDVGYAVRKELYNLYHILNHTNLFGGSYARQAEQMMQRSLAAIG
ncbi:fructosamine kinase family protein [Ferrigenium kumadai]|uniref:Fructosamine kinase family protein n=1 Tax=Ferrigenium kumadai TaxID=1682490 RepID=A0AAN1W198_9PROT|nr:fructosamine kinase family protein [Ferrigenium kumadai]BBJ00608.1 fructosamine kinase family protein [Ferrigenium kumadai]